MPKIMVKIKHLKAMKSVDKYVNYLAKRDGVDKTINQRVLIGKPTQKQTEFIDEMVKKCPEEKNGFEYQDYINNPTKQNASADVAGASVEATESGENKKTQKSEQTEAEASEPEQTSVNKKKGLFQNIKDKFRTKNSQQNNASTDVKKAEAVAKDKKEKQ